MSMPPERSGEDNVYSSKARYGVQGVSIGLGGNKTNWKSEVKTINEEGWLHTKRRARRGVLAR